MTRLLTFVLIMSAATIANAQYDDGLPMSDSLGSGVYGLGGGTSYNPGPIPATVPSYTPTYRQPQYQGGGFNTGQGISPQQIQNIANAAAQLGPALQQARQNLQQIRAQNGGYLIPRNNNGGLFGGGRIGNGRLLNRLANAGQRQPWQGMQRYTDTFGANDAHSVRQALIQNGYNNVQVYEDPNNAWRAQQGMQPIYGVYYDQR